MTGSVSSLARGVAVNVIQSLAVNEIKHIADSFGARDANNELIVENGQVRRTTESESIRVLLQGIAGCVGAAAQNASCSSGALGGSASALLNLLAELR